MKILFTADLHLKLNAKNIPKEWQKNRFIKLFDKLNEVAKIENCEEIIIGGDIFDKMPNLEELGFYFELIKKLQYKTTLYDGNHEATKKGATFLTLLSDATNSINNKVNVVDKYYISSNYSILPYCELKTKSFKTLKASTDILFTHVRGNIPPFVKEEVPISNFKPWKLVIAGDLHNHENSQENIVYPGAPMSVSFHRNRIDTGLLVIDTKDSSWKWLKINMPQLIRKTVKDPKEMLPDSMDHIIYELIGNSADISIEDIDHTLLDKRIIDKETNVSLNLKDKSIKEEIMLYLKEVAKLQDSQISDLIGVFDDFIKDTEVL